MLRGTVAARSQSDVVAGVAFVLTEFSHCANYQGRILVTRHTDPGWTIVFPFLKALVVERGGMLSHAAVVARELGIPRIVGVDHATRLIQDGAAIQLSLKTGEVRLQPDCTDGTLLGQLEVA